MEIGIQKAKANLEKLLQRITAGEEVIITKHRVPVARLLPVEPKPGERKLGLYRGKIWIADDFNAPLPPDILAGFLGEEPEAPKTKARPRRKKLSRP
jgi:prevent-host-death family protein